jgi:hypothetical protein
MVRLGQVSWSIENLASFPFEKSADRSFGPWLGGWHYVIESADSG